jgi:uncharacterized protein
MPAADQIIAALDLKPLPREGGYYRETYRSPDRIGPKSMATAIYYLLTRDCFSALHRLPAEEIFHFYAGDPVRMLQLFPDGTGRFVLLGPDVVAGHRPQVVVPRGVWQGSMLEAGGDFALLGTTMAPGFDFADYDGGDREALILQYPAFADAVQQLTR